MTEEQKPNPEGSEGGSNDPSIEDLQKQIENLNKGIATYRNDAKAARQEVAALQAQISEKKEEKKESDDGELPALSKEDQKRLEAWAKAQGFATKKELEEERTRIQGETLKNIENQAIEEFLSKHPEYNDDEQWDKLKKEFGLYKQPTNITGYRSLLKRVHETLNPKKEDGRAAARAEIETRKRLGLGGRGSSSSDEGEVTVEKLQRKYPGLTKEQIEGRLAEIRSLYPDKK